MTATTLLPLVVAFVVGLVLVPISIRLAPRAGLVVRPREDRWGARAIPMFGGLGVTGGILAGLAAGVIVGALAPVDALVVAGGIATLFALGFADDRGEVSPRVRLAIEAAVGAVTALVIASGLDLPLQVLAMLLALVAVPLAVNATNMVDNADGLAASLSTVTAITLAAATAVLAVGGASAVPLAVAGATVAFLLFNRPPARTFMGDAGSLPLGGALAAASILLVDAGLATSPETSVAAMCVVVLAWTAQAADMALVVTSRVRRGRSPFQGGTDHTSHRLLRWGLGPTAMLIVIAVGASLACALALVAAALGHTLPVLGVAVTLVGISGALVLESLLALNQPPTDAPDVDAQEHAPSRPAGAPWRPAWTWIARPRPACEPADEPRPRHRRRGVRRIASRRSVHRRRPRGRRGGRSVHRIGGATWRTWPRDA